MGGTISGRNNTVRKIAINQQDPKYEDPPSTSSNHGAAYEIKRTVNDSVVNITARARDHQLTVSARDRRIAQLQVALDAANQLQNGTNDKITTLEKQVARLTAENKELSREMDRLKQNNIEQPSSSLPVPKLSEIRTVLDVDKPDSTTRSVGPHKEVKPKSALLGSSLKSLIKVGKKNTDLENTKQPAKNTEQDEDHDLTRTRRDLRIANRKVAELEDQLSYAEKDAQAASAAIKDMSSKILLQQDEINTLRNAISLGSSLEISPSAAKLAATLMPETTDNAGRIYEEKLDDIKFAQIIDSPRTEQTSNPDYLFGASQQQSCHPTLQANGHVPVDATGQLTKNRPMNYVQETEKKQSSTVLGDGSSLNAQAPPANGKVPTLTHEFSTRVTTSELLNRLPTPDKRGLLEKLSPALCSNQSNKLLVENSLEDFDNPLDIEFMYDPSLRLDDSSQPPSPSLASSSSLSSSRTKLANYDIRRQSLCTSPDLFKTIKSYPSAPNLAVIRPELNSIMPNKNKRPKKSADPTLSKSAEATSSLSRNLRVRNKLLDLKIQEQQKDNIINIACAQHKTIRDRINIKRWSMAAKDADVQQLHQPQCNAKAKTIENRLEMDAETSDLKLAVKPRLPVLSGGSNRIKPSMPDGNQRLFQRRTMSAHLATSSVKDASHSNLKSKKPGLISKLLPNNQVRGSSAPPTRSGLFKPRSHSQQSLQHHQTDSGVSTGTSSRAANYPKHSQPNYTHPSELSDDPDLLDVMSIVTPTEYVS